MKMNKLLPNFSFTSWFKKKDLFTERLTNILSYLLEKKSKYELRESTKKRYKEYRKLTLENKDLKLFLNEVREIIKEKKDIEHVKFFIEKISLLYKIEEENPFQILAKWTNWINEVLDIPTFTAETKTRPKQPQFIIIQELYNLLVEIPLNSTNQTSEKTSKTNNHSTPEVNESSGSKEISQLTKSSFGAKNPISVDELFIYLLEPTKRSNYGNTKDWENIAFKVDTKQAVKDFLERVKYIVEDYENVLGLENLENWIPGIYNLNLDHNDEHYSNQKYSKWKNWINNYRFNYSPHANEMIINKKVNKLENEFFEFLKQIPANNLIKKNYIGEKSFGSEKNEGYKKIKKENKKYILFEKKLHEKLGIKQENVDLKINYWKSIENNIKYVLSDLKIIDQFQYNHKLDPSEISELRKKIDNAMQKLDYTNKRNTGLEHDKQRLEKNQEQLIDKLKTGLSIRNTSYELEKAMDFYQSFKGLYDQTNKYVFSGDTVKGFVESVEKFLKDRRPKFLDEFEQLIKDINNELAIIELQINESNNKFPFIDLLRYASEGEKGNSGLKQLIRIIEDKPRLIKEFEGHTGLLMDLSEEQFVNGIIMQHHFQTSLNNITRLYLYSQVRLPNKANLDLNDEFEKFPFLVTKIQKIYFHLRTYLDKLGIKILHPKLLTEEFNSESFEAVSESELKNKSIMARRAIDEQLPLGIIFDLFVIGFKIETEKGIKRINPKVVYKA